MSANVARLLLAVTCVFASIGGSPAQDQTRIGIKIIKHQPCFPEPATPGAQPTPAPMQFANSDRHMCGRAPLVPDDTNSGCYKIKGDVIVRQTIDGTFDTYSEVRSRMNQRPMACSSYDVNSDYGGYGTCIYGSNDCGSQAFKSTSIGIRSGTGNTVQCGKNVHMDPGTVKDVELSFCMPTKADFIKAQNVTEETWKQLQNATKGNQRIYLTVYVFNMKLNQLMHAQRKWMQDKAAEQDRQITEKAKGGGDDQPLGLPYDPTDDEFDNLPMQMAVHKQRKYIACHKVLADLFLPD